MFDEATMVEKAKYERAYKSPSYKMGNVRKEHAAKIMRQWEA